MLYENNDINKVLSVFKSKDETNVQVAKTLVMANQADFYEFWTDLSELFDQPYPKYDQHRLGLLGHFFMKDELEFSEESMPNPKLAYHLPPIRRLGLYGDFEDWTFLNDIPSLRKLELFIYQEEWMNIDLDMLRKKFPWIKEIVLQEFYYT